LRLLVAVSAETDYLFFFFAGFFAAFLAGFFLAFMMSGPSIVNPNEESRIKFDSVRTSHNLVRIKVSIKRNFPVTTIENFDR